MVQPELLRYKVFEPVLLLGAERFAQVDIRIRCKGGGYTSQIYAIRQVDAPPAAPRHRAARAVDARAPLRARREGAAERARGLTVCCHACRASANRRSQRASWLTTRSSWMSRPRRRSATSSSRSTARSWSLTRAAVSQRSLAAVARVRASKSRTVKQLLCGARWAGRRAVAASPSRRQLRGSRRLAAAAGAAQTSGVHPLLAATLGWLLWSPGRALACAQRDASGLALAFLVPVRRSFDDICGIPGVSRSGHRCLSRARKWPVPVARSDVITDAIMDE